MTAIYDTRDNLTAPKRGMYIQFMQLMRPKFIGNKYNSYTTDFRIDGYTHLWKWCHACCRLPYAVQLRRCGVVDARAARR